MSFPDRTRISYNERRYRSTLDAKQREIVLHITILQSGGSHLQRTIYPSDLHYQVQIRGVLSSIGKNMRIRYNLLAIPHHKACTSQPEPRAVGRAEGPNDDHRRLDSRDGVGKVRLGGVTDTEQRHYVDSKQRQER
jgi:hypothetical protein